MPASPRRPLKIAFSRTPEKTDRRRIRRHDSAEVGFGVQFAEVHSEARRTKLDDPRGTDLAMAVGHAEFHSGNGVAKTLGLGNEPLVFCEMRR